MKIQNIAKKTSLFVLRTCIILVALGMVTGGQEFAFFPGVQQVHAGGLSPEELKTQEEAAKETKKAEPAPSYGKNPTAPVEHGKQSREIQIYRSSEVRASSSTEVFTNHKDAVRGGSCWAIVDPKTEPNYAEYCPNFEAPLGVIQAQKCESTAVHHRARALAYEAWGDRLREGAYDKFRPVAGYAHSQLSSKGRRSARSGAVRKSGLSERQIQEVADDLVKDTGISKERALEIAAEVEKDADKANDAYQLCRVYAKAAASEHNILLVRQIDNLMRSYDNERGVETPINSCETPLKEAKKLRPEIFDPLSGYISRWANRHGESYKQVNGAILQMVSDQDSRLMAEHDKGLRPNGKAYQGFHGLQAPAGQTHSYFQDKDLAHYREATLKEANLKLENRCKEKQESSKSLKKAAVAAKGGKWKKVLMWGLIAGGIFALLCLFKVFGLCEKDKDKDKPKKEGNDDGGGGSDDGGSDGGEPPSSDDGGDEGEPPPSDDGGDDGGGDDGTPPPSDDDGGDDGGTPPPSAEQPAWGPSTGSTKAGQRNLTDAANSKGSSGMKAQPKKK